MYHRLKKWWNEHRSWKTHKIEQFLFWMRYINIANDILFAGPSLKGLALGNWIYWAFPESFSTRSVALSHVGRLSFITWVQCTAWWMACSCRHIGALNISVRVFGGQFLLRFIHKNQLQYGNSVCIALGKTLQSCPVKPRMGWILWDLLKEKLYQSPFSVVIVWKDLQMGGKETWM